MRVVERSRASRVNLRRVLGEIETSCPIRRTDYLAPRSLPSKQRRQRPHDDHALGQLIEQVGESETGMVAFWGDDRVTVVVPPFPVPENIESEGASAGPLLALLDTDYTVGVILLRLGRYAVGVLRGDVLISSKSGSRYVKSRHRAGGSSQRRFERSRERLVRELYDKCCEVTSKVFAPFVKRIDYVLLGGESHTLRGFRDRCGFIGGLADRTLSRTLNVDRPGKKALEDIPSEVWKSRVYVLELEDEG